jgi:hypothetical protein
MNERLKQLMQEAGYAAPELASRANKLAELIVRECARKVEDMIDNGWYADTGELKKHFGVEE